MTRGLIFDFQKVRLVILYLFVTNINEHVKQSIVYDCNTLNTQKYVNVK